MNQRGCHLKLQCNLRISGMSNQDRHRGSFSSGLLKADDDIVLRYLLHLVVPLAQAAAMVETPLLQPQCWQRRLQGPALRWRQLRPASSARSAIILDPATTVQDGGQKKLVVGHPSSSKVQVMASRLEQPLLRALRDDPPVARFTDHVLERCGPAERRGLLGMLTWTMLPAKR